MTRYSIDLNNMTNAEVTNVGEESNLTYFKPGYRFLKSINPPGGLFIYSYLNPT